VGEWGWEREVGIGGGRGGFWIFFFFEKRGGGGKGGVWGGGESFWEPFWEVGLMGYV